MELEEIATETEGKEEEDKGTKEPRPEVKKEEEADTDVYSKLQSPPEDLYAEAQWHRGASKNKAGNESVRLWKGLSAALAGICVLLLLIVLFLILKPQPGPLNCQELHNSATSGYPRCLCRECPVGWLKHDTSCFSLSTLRGSWDDGLKECTKKGGSLATVTTQQVQTFLNQKGTMKYWIGLRQNGTWTWVGNSPMGKSYWSDSRGTGDCVYMEGNSTTEGNWKQAPCQVKTYYICELQLVKN